MWNLFLSVVIALVASLGWMNALAAENDGQVSVTKDQSSIIAQDEEPTPSPSPEGEEESGESG